MNNNYDLKKHKIFIPRNPDKYVGNGNIITRSNYEMKFCQWLDMNSNVIEWASESLEIPYYDPISMKKRRYFPDFYMKVQDKDGKVIKYIIEIKPYKEIKPPVIRKNRKKTTVLKEQKVWETNKAKWKAAEAWCKKWGYHFKLVTEKQLFK